MSNVPENLFSFSRSLTRFILAQFNRVAAAFELDAFFGVQ